MEEIINLADRHGNRIGAISKLAAHMEGRLHEAFSIFIFNKRGELLLQRRALGKYHSGGLWSNTCCSHPRKDEDPTAAAHRRLVEEMGFDAHLHFIGPFIYRVELGNGLVEHEYDRVFVGAYEGDPYINPEEAMDAKWMPFGELRADVAKNPKAYTAWLSLILADQNMRSRIEAWTLGQSAPLPQLARAA